MGISAEAVKELREKTGAGMLDCKKALESASGDVDTAVDYLRKKGLATAAKKAGRVAADGAIVDAVNADNTVHILVEVNCETDFVVKTTDFQNYAKSIAGLVLEKRPKDVDELLALPFEGETVKDRQIALVAKIGENISVRRFATMRADGQTKIAKYIHAGSKIGVLVAFQDPKSELDDQLAKEVAMHVAAMSPLYVRKSDVPAEYLEKEKEIYKEQMADQKKPPEILEKIIMGKVNKHLVGICLEDQVFVKDPDGKASVGKILKKLGEGIKIKEFVRLQVGEGVEKKKADLAAEVAEMVK